MAGIPIKYDPDTINAEEREALHARRELFLNAFGNQPQYWMATGSGANRQFFAYPYSDRSQPVGCITLPDLGKPDSVLRNDLAGRQ
jgi:hypothetical protein